MLHRCACVFGPQVLPLVCAARNDVRVLVVGDGPLRVLLEEMREQHKVELPWRCRAWGCCATA
jgi:hypothetical protein